MHSASFACEQKKISNRNWIIVRCAELKLLLSAHGKAKNLSVVGNHLFSFYVQQLNYNNGNCEQLVRCILIQSAVVG